MCLRRVRMYGWVKHFIRSEKGGVAILVGLAAPVLFGAAALGIDASRLYVTKTKLQDAADAAAFGGAQQLPDGPVKSRAKMHASEAFYAQNRSDDGNKILKDTDIKKGKWPSGTGTSQACMKINLLDSGPDDAVKVVTRRAEQNGNPVNLFFAPIFALIEGSQGQKQSDVTACAIAAQIGGGSACLLVLDESEQGAMTIKENSEIISDNCGIHSNSSDAESLVTKNNSDVYTDFATAVGGIVKRGNFRNPSRAQGQQPKINDPLEGLQPPTGYDITGTGNCTHNDKEVNGNDTLNPGIYCGGIFMKQNSTINLNPGSYIIRGGKFEVGQNVDVSGSGVTIYLQGDNNGHDSRFVIRQNATFDISAPQVGPLKGIAVFEEQADNCGTRSCNNEEHRIRQNTDVDIKGTVYLPRSRLILKQNDETDVGTVIAKEFELKQNSRITLNSGKEGIPVPGGDVKLVR